MDHQTRKLVAEALLNAASTLSALTDRRLEYVLPGLAPRDQQSVLWIVFNAIGLERRVTPSITGFVIDGKRFQMYEKDKEGYKAVLDYLKDDLAKNTVVDAYIPWLANQFKKGNAQSVYQDLVRRFRAVCIWASETKTDLGKLTAQEALVQSEDYVSKESRKAAEKVKLDDQNPVVMTFPDGWFIRQLKTDEALIAEGEHQGHCVGEYCDAVQSGDSIIYSLRTPDDVPRVTIETQHFGDNEQAQQMFGRENAKPKPEWQKYLIEFAEKRLHREAKSMLLAGKPAREVDFSLLSTSAGDALNLKGANLEGAILTDANLEGANLEGANLEGANLEGANLEGANLEGANLEGANLEGADLTGSFLTDIKYDDKTIWPEGFTPPPSA